MHAGRSEADTLFVSLGTVREQIFAAEGRAVTVEIMRLEEPRPELFFRHLVRHILKMLLTHCSPIQSVSQQGGGNLFIYLFTTFAFCQFHNI